MLLRTSLVLIIISICLGDLYDTVVQKDEESVKIFNDPRNVKDSDMYNAMRTVGDAYETLTKHLRLRNASVIDVSTKLHKRGMPNLLTEVFSTDNLRVKFNWADSDMRYFNYLYNDVSNKWNTFDREYKNASLYF